MTEEKLLQAQKVLSEIQGRKTLLEAIDELSEEEDSLRLLILPISK